MDRCSRWSLTEILRRILKGARERDTSGSPHEEESDAWKNEYMKRSNRMVHVQALNPFDHYTMLAVKPFLVMFLQRINSVWYFFDEEALNELLKLEAYTSLPNSKMSELCMVLALGAQVSNGGNDDKSIMWYENARRYLDNENWGDELWIMRVTALISLYHIGERPDTSRHYLG